MEESRPEARREGRKKASFRIVLLVAALLCIPLASSHAVLLVGTNGTSLSRFDSSTPGTLTTVQVTGMQAGEQLVGIDFRPRNGLLYGVGSNGNLYILNFTTGVATKVGAGGGFQLNGTNYATAIDPVADQLRLIRSTPLGNNTRINLDTGVQIAEDGLVIGPYIIGDANPQNGPSGIAYSNHFPGASTTTCYAVLASVGRLYTVGDLHGDPKGAESGHLGGGADLVLEGVIDNRLGFDIAQDGTAYAAINFTGTFALYTINLVDGFATKKGNIGNGFGVTFFRGLAAQTGPQTFSNAQAILIPGSGDGGAGDEDANPYPSIINVSGLQTKVRSLKVILRDFRHTFPDDVDMGLQAPDIPDPDFGNFPGTLILFSDIGGGENTCGAFCNNGGSAGSPGPTITLDDAAFFFLPDTTDAQTGPLASGTYRPTNVGPDDPFPPPAPTFGNAAPGPGLPGDTLNIFKSNEPNGQWRLWVVDDGNNDTGRLAGGWSLEITTAPPCASVVCPPSIQKNNNAGVCSDKVEFPRAVVAGACGKVTYSHEPDTNFPVGTTIVNVTTADVDRFGNSKKCAFTVTVNDVEAPQITCPGDITVQADPGQNSKAVTFNAPAIGDNCSGATAAYSPASGAIFGVGTTTVTGTATDASGNKTTCTFNVTVTPSGGPGATPTPTPSGSPTPTPPATSLANISTRLRVETGDNVLIGGFIITGSEPKRLILRAIGPSLPFGDKLANPQLQLFSGGNWIASNDDWQNSINKQEIISTTIPPSNDSESAIVGTLDPGAYTAIVSGVDGTGVALVEAYDLSPNINSRLANISTRGLVQGGDNIMIAGTIVVGQASQKVIVRGIGPSLPLAGKLENPTLELRDGNGALLEANDNWMDSPNKQAILDSTIPPSNDLESAIVRVLPPANYTAILQGAGGTTGVAVVEVYALD